MKLKGSKNVRFPKPCAVCGNEFMASSKRNTMCGQACRNKRFNGTYGVPCKSCGKKTYSDKHILCQPCDVLRRNKETAERFKKRFFDKVDKTDGCWVWKGSRSSYGYGQFNIGDVCHLAHRVSCEIHFGPIPPGLQALHKCDNPPCVNPAHLYIGTALDNALDRVDKERWNIKC